MRQQCLNKLAEFCHSEYSCEQCLVFGIQRHPQRCLILPPRDAALDHKINNFLILLMLLQPRPVAALDIPLDALMDQYVSELVLCGADVKLRLRPQCVLQSLVVVV